MSLISDIEAMESRVLKLKTAAVGVGESAILQQRLRELHEVSIPLVKKVAQANLFRAQGLQLPALPAVVGQACTRVANVRQKFDNNRKAESLTQGRDWAYLKRYTKETKESVVNVLTTEWQRYIAGLFTGESPNDLGITLAPTDTNNRELDSYKQEWGKLHELKKNLPESEKEFATAKDIADRLREIHGKFERDVPEEVKTFLEAVGREGAGLELLTENVRQWLEENRSINSYQIVAK